MLTVQESSGLYQAVQYDGTNGLAIYTALQGVDYSNIGGVLSFRSFIMRAGGLLTSGHRFNMNIGDWIVWVQDVNPYVVGGPMTDAEFAQQYQVAASAAEIAALQAEVAALDTSVATLNTTVTTLGTTVTALGVTVLNLGTSVTSLSGTVTAQGTQIGNNTAAIGTNTTAISANATAITNLANTVAAGFANISGAQITSGTVVYQRLTQTIPENQVVVLFNRPTLVTPGTALDTWQMHYNGNRTIYGNEFNLLRVRGVPEDQVVARFMSNAARDGLVTAIVQASLANATSHLFQVLGNGDILGPGGASMLPTAPVAVTFNGSLGNAALITDGSANTGAPYPATTTLYAADNRVYMDGSIANNGAGPITGGTLLFTIAAAHRPTAWVQFNVRTSTTLSTRVTIRGATGQVYADQSLAVGATLSLDGLNYRKA